MKVTISDKVFEVTDEQLEKIKEIVKAKPKFKPITVCHLRIEISPVHPQQIRICEAHKEEFICSQTITEAQETVKALLSAIDFIEN